MTLYTIAYKNIQRRRGKMLLLVLSLTLAAATLVSIATLITAFNSTVNKSLDQFGFNLLVTPKRRQLNLVYGDLALGQVATEKQNYLTAANVKKVKEVATGKVQAVSEKLLQAIFVNKKKVLLAGVNLAKEKKVKHWWQIEAGAFPRAANEVLVGLDAAEKLKLEPSETFLVNGSKLKVAGILMATGSQDDNIMFAPLTTVQQLFKLKGKLSLIEVLAKKTELVDVLLPPLKKALPKTEVKSVKQAIQFKATAMNQLVKFGLAVTVLVFAISGLVVFSVMASAINERRREIGIFRAIGFKQQLISKIVLTEVISLSLTGGTLGYLVGFLVVKLLPFFWQAVSYRLSFNFTLFFAAVGLAVFVGLIAGLIPALRAARLEPVEALKNL